MQINYNIISLIDILGMIQGIILGVLLLIINKKRDKSTLFLGAFIILYALEFLPTILEDLNILSYYPQYNSLPFGFSGLLFPIFYIYVQQVSIITQKKTKYWVLIPGGIIFIIDIIVFFQSSELKTEIDDSIWYNLITLLGILYSIFIGIHTVKWINKHILLLKDQYTSLEHRELRWAKLFVIAGLSFVFILFFFEIFIETGFYFEVFISATNVLLLYWISLKGILQQNVKPLIDTSIKENNHIILSKIENPIVTTKKDFSNLLQSLEQYILEEKAFTKEDLTIIDVAEKIGVHPKQVSGAINSQLGQNFNTYINNYRIEKAKELLKSDTANNLSIEGIGYEVGFQSKSTFYDAFKKSTKTTPSKYKNS